MKIQLYSERTVCILSIVSIVIGVHCSSALIIAVPDHFETIQVGIEIAFDGDTVLVSPGYYIENIDFIGKAIIVGSLMITTGNPVYIDSTTIDGGGMSCAVCFVNGEDQRSVLSGFTITGGVQNFGGGIDCQSLASPRLENLLVRGNLAHQIGGGIYCTWGSTPTIRRVIITGNEAEDGAGIGFAHQCHPIVEDVEIFNNTAAYSGGGVFAGHGSGECTLRRVLIYDNTAVSGGGAYFETTSHNRLEDVHVYNNQASHAGGGIYFRSSDATLRRCTIENNLVTAGVGGGLTCWNSASLDLSNCTIKNNTAVSGGGVDNYSQARIRFRDCVITGNHSLLMGGGISHRQSAQSILLNTTLFNNSSDSVGGAIYGQRGIHAVVINSILWENHPQEIYLDREEDLAGEMVTIAYSNVSGGEDGIAHDELDSIQWLDGNLNTDPSFTAPERDSLHLSEESPCIDAGTAFLIINGMKYLDYPNCMYDGIAPDMGAFESESANSSLQPSPVPGNFTLFNPYPNPFNATTVFTYSLQAENHVRLTVSDLSGRVLETLINESQVAGHHQLTWISRDIPAGIYLCHLTSGGEVKTTKVVKVN